MPESLINRHGGYRNLKSFQIAQLIYDCTIRFCDRYLSRRSRTHDQMVQAARSGVQNIAEGSQASATSKKMEIKLTQVARASLEELRLDYQDFLRHRKLAEWPREHPLRQSLIQQRCQSADQVAKWVVAIARSGAFEQAGSNEQEMPASPFSYEDTYPALSANAILVLINVANSLLDRQVESLAAAFENEGGFSEKLYRIRSNKRKRP